jgi:cytochrome c oxidase cbb3-type subunit 2
MRRPRSALATLAGTAARGVLGAAGLGLLIGGPLAATSPALAAGDVAARVATATVTAVVRTDLGQLKWVETAPAEYTPLEEEGRRLYNESGCAYCHSQYRHPTETEIRPWGIVSADRQRWGPETEAGEHAAYRRPPLGAEGIAPDLSRTGLKYGDEWHWAHFWNPPMVRPGSIMGAFGGYFDNSPGPIAIVEGPHGDTLERTPMTEALFDFDSDALVELTPNADGLLFAPMSARGKHPVITRPNDEFDGDALTLVAETPKIAALTAYVQKLGMQRGKWRELYTPDESELPVVDMERSDEMIARGRIVYEENCLGCHGVKGDGNGPAAAFMNKQRPRNFTFGVFKFKHVDGPLPTDADLLRTISRGVRGTAMPAWFELPLEDRLAVIQYVKYELAVDRSDPGNPWYYFVEEGPGAALEIGEPPEPSADLVARGGEIWRAAKCWECHGETGAGDGEKAAGLRDATGFYIVPANLTLGLFKSGPTVRDIFRTISVGLSGTPMPAFKDAFREEDRWALAYFVLSLSAYADPITGEPLPLPDVVRRALNAPKLATPTPADAYRIPSPDEFAPADAFDVTQYTGFAP